MKKTLSFLLCFIIAFSVPVSAFATDLHSSEIVLTKSQLKSDARYYIENALKYAKNNANDNNPVSVILPSGKYYLKNCLHIYSNTNLILQPDTQLVKDFADGNMLKCGLQEEVNSGYEGYKNITVTGGIWNENYNGTSCGMRFAHCENVTLKDLTVKKNKNSHHIEIAAAKNFNIINCTFSGYQRTNSADGMAVQLDVLHNSMHFPSYAYYDDTPCQNITVKGCTFDGVYAGVGSYAGVIGSYFNNVVIRDNVFSNIKDKAIAAFNFVNSKIYNNTINGATIGILFEYFPSDKLSSRFYMPNDAAASTLITLDSNCKIKANTVNVKRSVNRSNASGIAVYGGIISKENAKSYHLQAGKYYVQNMEISKNNITVNSAAATGMWLQYLYYCNVKKNTVHSAVTSSGGYNGVTLYHSCSNLFSGNNVNGFDNSLAFRTKSKSNMLTGNILQNTQQYGLAVDSTSRITVNYGNTFVKNAKGKILIRKKTYQPNSKSVKELSIENGVITWKRIKKCSGYKVFRSTKKTKGYTEIATLNGNKNTSYTDTDVKKGEKYYYKIAVYRRYKGSVIYGKPSEYVKVKYK